MSTKVGGICFFGFWIVFAIGMNMERETPEGKAQADIAWEQAPKIVAEETECDDLHYPGQCEEIRRQAESDAKKKLEALR